MKKLEYCEICDEPNLPYKENRIAIGNDIFITCDACKKEVRYAFVWEVETGEEILCEQCSRKIHNLYDRRDR